MGKRGIRRLQRLRYSLSRRPGLLAAIGRRYEARGADPDRGYLLAYEKLLGRRPKHVVLVLGPSAIETAATFAERYRTAQIHLLTLSKPDPKSRAALPVNVRHRTCPSIADRVTYLAGMPAPELIVEGGNNKKGQKRETFRQLFPFLADGGWYAVEDIDSVGHPANDDVPGENVAELLERLPTLPGWSSTPEAAAMRTANSETDNDALAHAVARITRSDRLVLVQRRGSRAAVKLRDTTATDVLDRRLGDRWGEVVETRPAHSYPARATFTMSRPGPFRAHPTVSVPELSLRRYRNPTVAAYQVVMTDGFYLPDTFRHPLQARLNHHLLHDVSPHLATYRDGRPVRPETRLDGTFFYFDTEYPGHFGHVVTEVLSRNWGWQAAAERYPDLRPLVSLRADGRGWPEFEQRLLAALDIPVERVAFVEEGTPVVVETLLAATPAFALPNYSDDSLGDTWSRVADRLRVTGLDTPRRFFVTRSDELVRPCHNRDEVEQFFADRGFAIVDPATLPIDEQITMFGQADIVAGFGGSGLFNAMFSPHSRKIIVSGDSYTANNEYLIGAAAGGEYCYAWGNSDIPHPPNGWGWDAFVSGFRVDLEDLGPFLDHWIDEPLTGREGSGLTEPFLGRTDS